MSGSNHAARSELNFRPFFIRLDEAERRKSHSAATEKRFVRVSLRSVYHTNLIARGTSGGRRMGSTGRASCGSRTFCARSSRTGSHFGGVDWPLPTARRRESDCLRVGATVAPPVAMSKTLLVLALSFIAPRVVHAKPGTISPSYTHSLAVKALKNNQGPTKRTLGARSVESRYTVFKVEPKRAGETDTITVDTHVFVKGERGDRGQARARFQREGQL